MKVTEVGLNESEIRAFLEAEYSRVVSAVTLVTGDRGSAEDSVAEAVARAWERSERGSPIVSLRAWVAVAAMNHARSGLRRLRAERRYRSAAVERERTTPVPRDEILDLRRALAALPRRQREMTVLRYYLDLDVADIADRLGVTEGATKASLHKARRALAVALEVQDMEEANDVAGL